MNKDTVSDAKSPPPTTEQAALSPGSSITPPIGFPREPNEAPLQQAAQASGDSQKKRGRKRKPTLESVDPEEAKRIHNANNKKLRDDQNELFAQLKRMVGIEAQAKKTTVLIRVVEHMQRQEETINSLRRRLEQFEQQSVSALKAFGPAEAMEGVQPDTSPSNAPQSAREAALIEQLNSARKALTAMQKAHHDASQELDKWRNKVKGLGRSEDEKSSPTKTELRRHSASKRTIIGPPAAMLPKPRTTSPVGPVEDASREEECKASSMDALASLSTLALAAERNSGSTAARPPPAAAGVSPPTGAESEPRSSALHDEWLSRAELRLSFWRHGKALRHQPGRSTSPKDKAARMKKLPRPLFDCRQSGREVKQDDSNYQGCAAATCTRGPDDNNWVSLPCGDRVHKECYTDGQACFASRSVFFVPPPSLKLWRMGNSVSFVPSNTASEKPLGCIPCFGKNDGPALAIPFSMLGSLKDQVTSERILAHVEVQHGGFEGDSIVELAGVEPEKDERYSPNTRTHQVSSPSRASSPSATDPLVHHLAAQAPDGVLHLCFKPGTSIRYRSHKRDDTDVIRVFRLRFKPPDGPPLHSPWFFLAATSWSNLAEKGAKIVPGDHATGQAVLDALVESGGGAD